MGYFILRICERLLYKIVLVFGSRVAVYSLDRLLRHPISKKQIKDSSQIRFY